jgi:hypothetical protein
MDFSCNFQPRQIVCLEHLATCLYAEVIQVVASRQIGWVRPLLLAEFPIDNQRYEEPLIYDLRSGADLLWSLAVFRPALDTEVMPLLLQLLGEEPPLDREGVAFTRLNQFIHQAWQAQKQGLEAGG